MRTKGQFVYVLTLSINGPLRRSRVTISRSAANLLTRRSHEQSNVTALCNFMLAGGWGGGGGGASRKTGFSTFTELCDSSRDLFRTLPFSCAAKASPPSSSTGPGFLTLSKHSRAEAPGYSPAEEADFSLPCAQGQELKIFCIGNSLLPLHYL